MTEPLDTLLTRKAKENKDKPYLYFRDEVVSYEEINARANKMAHALRSLGVEKGDHVTIILPNCPEYLYCWFGLAKLGAVSVTINTQMKGSRLASLIDVSDSKLVITSPDFVARFNEIDKEHKIASRVIMDVSGQENENDKTLTMHFKSAPDTAPTGNLPTEDTEPLIIGFTSGTTGLPKLVRNSHRAYITAAKDLAADYLEISAQERIYSSLPLYHANPQVYCILTALIANASVIVAPKFSASRFWHDVRKYNATAFSYVGAILPILLAQPEQPEDKKVPAKKCFGGGAPKEVYLAITKRFGVEVLELYGMSETGTFNTINRPGRGKAGTVGQIREGFEIKIFDDKDNELPLGNVGEIVIRPTKPYIMFDGYYGSPEETVKCSSNWWFHTGDLGKIDDEGYYYFCGRTKEGIRRGGENISAYDVERAINAHRAVAESAAFGIEDAVMGEEIGVAIVLRSSQTVNPKEIITWCESKLPRFMLPRYIEFLDQLPKSATEKVQKAKLKERGKTSATWDRLKRSKK